MSLSRVASKGQAARPVQLLLVLALMPCFSQGSEPHLTPALWTDTATKLTWTAKDNGSGLSWTQALRYCRELSLGGFKDWTLPSIDDLQGIFDKAQNDGGFHVRGPIHMTGWQWSSTPGSQKGEGWAFDFGDRGRASVYAGDSGLNRALCVRR